VALTAQGASTAQHPDYVDTEPNPESVVVYPYPTVLGLESVAENKLVASSTPVT